ncbi:YdcF family protein [Inquilinus sp. Marseille-Q2685]|uniref:YdcF family protein n=1 Tax=Inquilinus sp. Marseille-Q2685 TaxID=2866581 RepID=UPI001CE43BC7|nr:YdcF family protein [Inquilinus sp. Marseille-Q2685]
MSSTVDPPPKPRPWRRRLRRALLLLVVLAAAWGLGLAWFVAQAGRGGEVDPDHTDAIVVLTGGSERLRAGLDLLARGTAERLLVSGVHRDVRLEELFALSPTDDSLRCCVDLGYAASDTIGNAREAAAWMRAHGFRSLRLVTSNYHMPRSMLEFRAAMPDIEIKRQPVDPGTVHLDRWWAWPGTARLIVSEYNKFLVALARVTLGRI